MPLINTYKIKGNAKKGHGFIMVEVVMSVAIIGILSVTGIGMYVNVTNNANDASMKSDISHMASLIEASLIEQDEEKLIVENGGKFPTISIDPDIVNKNATLFVANERQIVDINSSNSVSYEISTDIDGYTISGFVDMGRNKKAKEILRYDSETRKIENLEQ